jgi:hypothetical protein
MVRGNMMISILDQVKILNQKIRPSRLVAEQSLYLLKRVGCELATLGKGPGPLARVNMPCRPVRPAGASWGFVLHRYSVSLPAGIDLPSRAGKEHDKGNMVV